MKENELVEVVREALAEVYSGASLVEAEALIDKLNDRGIVCALHIDDPRVLDDEQCQHEYTTTNFHGVERCLACDEELASPLTGLLGANEDA